MKTTGIILILLFLLGCQSKTVNRDELIKNKSQFFELLGNDIFPEGICVDQINGTLYTGSIKGRGIQKTYRGKTKYFLSPGNSIVSNNILGMAVDHSNNRLWVCSNNLKTFFENRSGDAKLSVFDTKTGELIRTISEKDLDSQFQLLFGDVITDSKGNSYATNLADNVLIYVSKDFSVIKTWTNFPKTGNDNFFLLNGLDIDKNEEFIIVSTYKTGYDKAIATLFKVDINNGNISEIDCSDSVLDFKENGIDGLAFVNDNTLLGISGNGKLLKIILSNNNTKAIITDVSTGNAIESMLYEPSTIAVYEGNLYTTNSQASRYFTNKPIILPFRIVKIPLSIIDL